MLRLNARYAPYKWWPWYARGIGPRIGGDYEKAAFAAVELRRISPRVFARCLRPPFNWGYSANLCWANLCGADLSRADLTEANLREANLYGANLRAADLCGADLSRADLCWANLREATWNVYTCWPDGFTPPATP